MTVRVFVLPAGDSEARIGTAFLTDHGDVITCAHVLRDGHYRLRPQTPSEPGEAVRLEIIIGEQGEHEILVGELLPCPWIVATDSYFPYDNDLEERKDVVALRLPSPMRADLESVRFRSLIRSETGRLRCFGVTEKVQQGLEATVNLAATSDLRGLRQLNWTGTGGVPIDQGFSGAPVEDDRQYIVGMVVTRRFPASNDPYSPPLGFMNSITNIAEL